jgi:hypothetical protein
MIDSVKASQEGLRLVDEARRKKRWNKTAEVWCSHALTSRATLSRFWAGYSIRTEVFTAICEAVGVNWQDVADQSQPQNNCVCSTTSVNVKIRIGNVSCDRATNSIETTGDRHDWGEAPDTSIFYGRTHELNTLHQCIVQNNCRLVGVLGMGGMGKTALVTKFARSYQDEFEAIIWRNLHHASNPDDFLADLIQRLARQEAIALPATLGGKLVHLLKYLRKHRCLLILDGVEAILHDHSEMSDCQRQVYQNGYEGYGQLLACLGETHHASCLVFTSQEMLKGLSNLEGEALSVRCLQLNGLSQLEGRHVAETKGMLTGSEAEWSTLIDRYAGNPLAIKLVASTIRDVFGGSIAAFLNLLQHSPFLVNEVQELLEKQIDRLSSIEQDLLYWLAINPNPMSLEELQEGLRYSVSMSAFMSAIARLQRCALIDIANPPNAIYPNQQSVVLRYKTNALIQQIGWGISKRHDDMKSNDTYLETTEVTPNIPH